MPRPLGDIRPCRPRPNCTMLPLEPTPNPAPGPLLSFLEWWPLAQELAERAAVAGMLGEVDGRIDGLRRVLLVEQTDSNS